jgi:hypothetical protein
VRFLFTRSIGSRRGSGQLSSNSRIGKKAPCRHFTKVRLLSGIVTGVTIPGIPAEMTRQIYLYNRAPARVVTKWSLEGHLFLKPIWFAMSRNLPFFRQSPREESDFDAVMRLGITGYLDAASIDPCMGDQGRTFLVA